MGLDARVYCDCYEKGRLREPPPPDVLVRLAPDGGIESLRNDCPIEAMIQFDDWRQHRACEHQGGVMLHHRLGNIGTVALLRTELQQEASLFPILMNKVLYNGIHAGDYLPVDLIPPLEREVESLARRRCNNRSSENFMKQFQTQMAELIAAAHAMSKPIVF